MKNLILSVLVFTTSIQTWASLGYDDTRMSHLTKGDYSQNMFLMLDCLDKAGQQTNTRSAGLALEFCQGEGRAIRDVKIVYQYMPSLLVIDLDRHLARTSDLIVCLSGVRGQKTSEVESEQLAKDNQAIAECKELLIKEDSAGFSNGLLREPLSP